MLDAICILPKSSLIESTNNLNPKLENSQAKEKVTFSIFEFKILSAPKIALYRHSLFCPECLQVAYFRRASKDGKQACFGSRYHLSDCSELKSPNKNSSNKKSLIVKNEEKSKLLEGLSLGIVPENNNNQEIVTHKLDIVTAAEDGFIIDFMTRNKVSNNKLNSTVEDNQKTKNSYQKMQTEAEHDTLSKKESVRTIKQSLPKLLKSLLNNSSIATSDVWVFTSEKHKWRAKNLFVKLAEAQVLDNFAPRMYWGTISSIDKELLWLNVADAKNIAIPIKLFQQEFLDKYSIEKSTDLIGASIILFAKCLSNKDQSRKFLQLWSNDLQYLYLSLAIK